MASVTERLEALASCLCAQIAADGSPTTCFCGLLPGSSVAHDYTSECEEACGMAWVRLTVAQPLAGLGGVDQQADTLNNCGLDLGFDVEVGIVRCADLGENGEPPTSAQQLAMAEQQVKDMLTMRTAIACCDIGDRILRDYTPVGPQGGVVGGTWTVSLALAG